LAGSRVCALFFEKKKFPKKKPVDDVIFSCSASGHTAKFSDYMVRDEKTRMCYRADHVLKGHLQAVIAKAETTEDVRKEAAVALARVDDLDQAGLTAALKKWDAKSPDTGNNITDPAPFNLMF
jgi:glycyl-tRNA synthetase